jgi:hypothetical protein
MTRRTDPELGAPALDGMGHLPHAPTGGNR